MPHYIRVQFSGVQLLPIVLVRHSRNMQILYRQAPYPGCDTPYNPSPLLALRACTPQLHGQGIFETVSDCPEILYHYQTPDIRVFGFSYIRLYNRPSGHITFELDKYIHNPDYAHTQQGDSFHLCAIYPQVFP